MTPEYVDRVPTPEEHRRPADSVGWTHAFDWDAIPASLSGESTAFSEGHGFAVHPGMTGMFRVVPERSQAS